MTSVGLSFCDCIETLCSKEYTLPFTAEYIYIGSYFCDRYFVNTADRLWTECLDRTSEMGAKAVLVIPLSGQTLLEAVKEKIVQLMHSRKISELVVNDPGMLRWCREQFPETGIWSGRLMSKEIRDPRYDMGIQNLDRLEGASGGSLYGYPILGVEADPVHPLKHKPASGCLLAVHTPYAFVSASRYCELGSLSHDLAHKFRLDVPCKRECISCRIVYENMGIRFFKAGRAVFTGNRHLKLQDMECDRVIYAAGYEWRKDEITDSGQQC